MRSDLFGCNRMHFGAFGRIRALLDIYVFFLTFWTVFVVFTHFLSSEGLTESPKLQLRTGAASRRSVLSFYNSALWPSDPSDGRIRPVKGPLSGLLSGLQVAWPKGPSWNY